MEENKIQEVEIVSENIAAENLPVKEKLKFRNKLLMIFFLGFLLGVAFKTEALRKITIGYGDYLMNIKTQDYDINQMQEDLSKRMMEEMQAQDAQDEAGDADGAESDLAPEEEQEANNQTEN